MGIDQSGYQKWTPPPEWKTAAMLLYKVVKSDLEGQGADLLSALAAVQFYEKLLEKEKRN